jgi:hypothetical protein
MPRTYQGGYVTVKVRTQHRVGRAPHYENLDSKTAGPAICARASTYELELCKDWSSRNAPLLIHLATAALVSTGVDRYPLLQPEEVDLQRWSYSPSPLTQAVTAALRRNLLIARAYS